MKIWKSYTFEAAHCVATVPPGHKCARLHGHSFRVTLEVDGPYEPTTGWVMDFHDISELWKPLHEILDHHYLNEIAGLDNPTSENIARWIWSKLKRYLPELTCITVSETPDSGAEYRG